MVSRALCRFFFSFPRRNRRQEITLPFFQLISRSINHTLSGVCRPVMDWAGLGHLNLPPVKPPSAHRALSEPLRAAAAAVKAGALLSQLNVKRLTSMH